MPDMQNWLLKTQQTPVSPLSRTNSLCAPLDFGLLYVGGDDAKDFLQNQLSNDINKVTEDFSQLSSFSTHKGRMLGIFRVISIEGGYLLWMPKSILESTQADLQKYIISAKVVVADVSEQFAALSVQLEKQPEDFPDWPKAIDQVLQTDSEIVIRLPTASGFRYLVLATEVDIASAMWKQLQQQASVNHADSYHLQDILAGIANIFPATREAFVAQMSNLQLVNGVSFKKGCFPGQEVVARMQYLGKLKRRMYRIAIHTDQCPQPGAEMVSRETATTASKPDGSAKLVDAVQLAENLVEALVIGQIDKLESVDCVLWDQPQANWEIQPLPYSF